MGALDEDPQFELIEDAPAQSIDEDQEDDSDGGDDGDDD